MSKENIDFINNLSHRIHSVSRKKIVAHHLTDSGRQFIQTALDYLCNTIEMVAKDTENRQEAYLKEIKESYERNRKTN